MPVSSISSQLAGIRVAGTIAFFVVTGLTVPAAAMTTPRNAAPHPGDSAAVIAAVTGFHTALESGDSAKAMSLLAADAIILESGDVESRAEYRSHHLSSDMKFAQAIRGTWSMLRVTVNGDVAWVSSSNKMKGEISGRPIDSVGAELMVLIRTKAGWKISAIHWSSHNQRPLAK